MTRKLTGIVVIVMTVGCLWFAVHNSDKQMLITPGPTQGPKPNGPTQGPKPNRPPQRVVDWAPINARMKVLLATREPVHVGGISQ